MSKRRIVCTARQDLLAWPARTSQLTNLFYYGLSFLSLSFSRASLFLPVCWGGGGVGEGLRLTALSFAYTPTEYHKTVYGQAGSEKR